MANANVSYDRPALKGRYSVGTIVNYTCHSGYGIVEFGSSVYTSNSSTCEFSGRWSIDFNLTRYQCGGNQM